MNPHLISFRFLQAVMNAVTDDRITVGLLHWDDQSLRFVGDSTRVGDNRQETIYRYLSALQIQIQQINYKIHKPNLSLEDVFPVPEGRGSFFPYWGEIQQGLTSDPKQHFEDLIQLAELQNYDLMSLGNANHYDIYVS